MRAWPTIVAVVWIAGCSCDPPGRGCDDHTDCTSGRACVDGRCVARTDGGDATDDASADRDAQPIDAPPADRTCASVESAAREIRRPIDAIVLPDESASMGPARDSVAAAMETTFRTTMETAGIDYRVI